jgi:NAD(P)-dependent dehydrogenase (short-subunit alcohol dehydrogenase family)
VRRFLPDLMDRIWNRNINPAKVFDLELPFNDAASGYRPMDTRQATQVLLRPETRRPDKETTSMNPTYDFTGDLVRDLAMKRLGTGEEIADAVRWLCSPGSTFVTGQALAVDSGRAAQ